MKEATIFRKRGHRHLRDTFGGINLVTYHHCLTALSTEMLEADFGLCNCLLVTLQHDILLL